MKRIDGGEPNSLPLKSTSSGAVLDTSYEKSDNNNNRLCTGWVSTPNGEPN